MAAPERPAAGTAIAFGVSIAAGAVATGPLMRLPGTAIQVGGILMPLATAQPVVRVRPRDAELAAGSPAASDGAPWSEDRGRLRNRRSRARAR